MPQQKKKRFSLFNLAKDGKGVRKEDKITRFTFGNFFVLFGRRFGTIVSVNLAYVFGNFPVWFFLLGRSGLFGVESRMHTNLLYPAFRAAVTEGFNPVTAALAGVIGQRQLTYVLTPFCYVLMLLSVLVIFTFGPVNAGCAYILRNSIKSEPVFFFSDMKYAIKKNLKQSLLFGALDAVLLVILGYDLVFFYYNATDFLKRAMFFGALFIAVVYFVMRFYLYIMMVTFDLSIWKLIKNSFIFAIVGFKRNFVACLGIILTCTLCYLILSVYLPLGAILPFVLLFGMCSFMAIYAAYPKMKEIMIDPYYKDGSEEEEAAEEPVFHDHG